MWAIKWNTQNSIFRKRDVEILWFKSYNPDAEFINNQGIFYPIIENDNYFVMSWIIVIKILRKMKFKSNN